MAPLFDLMTTAHARKHPWCANGRVIIRVHGRYDVCCLFELSVSFPVTPAEVQASDRDQAPLRSRPIIANPWLLVPWHCRNATETRTSLHRLWYSGVLV